jgi:hypothetical protein
MRAFVCQQVFSGFQGRGDHAKRKLLPEYSDAYRAEGIVMESPEGEWSGAEPRLRTWNRASHQWCDEPGRAHAARFRAAFRKLQKRDESRPKTFRKFSLHNSDPETL